MAQIPSNNTARLRMIYLTTGGVHKCGIRLSSSLGAIDDGKAFFDALLEALQLYLPSSFDPIGMEYLEEGSDIAYPIVHMFPSLTLNNDDVAGVQRATQFRWEGRAVIGSGGQMVASKVSLSMFNLIVSPAENFRYPRGAVDAFDDVIDLLNQEADPGYENILLAVNGGRATFYGYTNFNYNNHYERRFRA